MGILHRIVCGEHYITQKNEQRDFAAEAVETENELDEAFAPLYEATGFSLADNARSAATAYAAALGRAEYCRGFQDAAKFLLELLQKDGATQCAAVNFAQ